MLLTATIELAAPGERPPDVAPRALALLRNQALVDERTSLKLIARGRPNSPFIADYQSRLADAAVAWREVVYRLFEATLTETMSFAGGLDFIGHLMADRPDVLTSGSLSIMADHFRWPGSPADSTGTLRLWDFKGWIVRPPQMRSSLNVSLTYQGASLGDPAFLAALRTVAAHTGIPFDRGRLSASGDRDAASDDQPPEIDEPDR